MYHRSGLFFKEKEIEIKEVKSNIQKLHGAIRITGNEDSGSLSTHSGSAIREASDDVKSFTCF